MSKKKLVKLLSIGLCLLCVLPTLSMPANAGAVKKLVEVDAEEREKLEQERIRMQEEYEAEAKKLAEERQKLEELRAKEQARKDALTNAQKLREDEITQISEGFAQPVEDLSEEKHDHSKQGASCSCNFFCILCKVITLPISIIGSILPHTNNYSCHLCSRFLN